MVSIIFLHLINFFSLFLLMNNVIGSIMVGMDMFTEGAITGKLTIRREV